jgi:hypothetical protein
LVKGGSRLLFAPALPIQAEAKASRGKQRAKKFRRLRRMTENRSQDVQSREVNNRRKCLQSNQLRQRQAATA